jgi:hypothetical protein
MTQSVWAQSTAANSQRAQNLKPKAEAISPLKRADVISVKAALEEMIVRRYSQELSALVTFEKFNVGARFELDVVDDTKSKDSRGLANQGDMYTDLDLGYLDADTLFDRYASIDAGSVSPLAKYAIKSVVVNVGLQKKMGEDIKKTVEDWLTARVKDEFGALGKSQVQFIQSESSNPPTTFDRILQMQSLVGQLILALAILLGVILWRLLSGGSSQTESQPSAVNIESKTEMTAGEGVMGTSSKPEEDSVAKLIAQQSKLENVSEQIKTLAPKLITQLDQLVNQWCEQGDSGLMQIACFAEISGSVLGSLPIPREHKKRMGDIFSQMSDLSVEKRLEVSNKTYWDLVASLNLGTDSLYKPFSFLGNSTLGTVNQVLLGNDSDIQTVVSLYMPENLRKNYFSKLDNEKKIELLNTAAKLSSISQQKLKDIETQIAPYFDQKVSDTDVSLAMTLNKLIDSMSYLDACRILPKVKGPMVEEYKLRTPHIGFFNDWTQACQELLIKRSTNEELTAYLRVMPQMTESFLELISPRARQILEDDLSREDQISDAEKERLLLSLHNRLVNLIYTNVVSLEDAIKKKASSSGEGMSVAA